jgi:hypothetical protein
MAGFGRGAGGVGGSGRGSASSHSIANTYHSMSRGQVRIVIDRATHALGRDGGAGAGNWGERLWPVPPGHPAHQQYYYGYEYDYDDSGITGEDGHQDGSMKARSEIGSNTDPNQWSVASQDGSGSVPERTMATARGAPPMTMAPRRVDSGGESERHRSDVDSSKVGRAL